VPGPYPRRDGPAPRSLMPGSSSALRGGSRLAEGPIGRKAYTEPRHVGRITSPIHALIHRLHLSKPFRTITRSYAYLRSSGGMSRPSSPRSKLSGPTRYVSGASMSHTGVRASRATRDLNHRKPSSSPSRWTMSQRTAEPKTSCLHPTIRPPLSAPLSQRYGNAMRLIPWTR
jgi:hypothetical protein